MPAAKKHLIEADSLWDRGLEGNNKGMLFEAMLKAAKLTSMTFNRMIGSRASGNLLRGSTTTYTHKYLQILLDDVRSKEPGWLKGKEEIFIKKWGMGVRIDAAREAQIAEKEIHDRVYPWQLPQSPEECRVRLAEYETIFAQRGLKPIDATEQCDIALGKAWKNLTPLTRFAGLVVIARRNQLGHKGKGINVDRMAALALGVSEIASFAEARTLQDSLQRLGIVSANDDNQPKLHHLFAGRHNLDPRDGEPLPAEEETTEKKITKKKVAGVGR